MREAVATLARRGLRDRLREVVGPPLRRPDAGRVRDRAFAAMVRAAELTLVGLGFALLPVWPFVVALILRDARSVRRYPRGLRDAARHIAAMLRGRSIARYLLGRLRPGERPRGQIAGQCTHCGNCCLYGNCVCLAFDARGQSRCQIYGGRLWRVLACGDYPLDGEEIELFACPSFVERPAAQQARHVIPIVSAGFSPAPPREGAGAGGASSQRSG